MMLVWKMVQIETPVDYQKTVSWRSWEAGSKRWNTGIILVSPHFERYLLTNRRAGGLPIAAGFAAADYRLF